MNCCCMQNMYMYIEFEKLKNTLEYAWKKLLYAEIACDKYMQYYLKKKS